MPKPTGGAVAVVVLAAGLTACTKTVSSDDAQKRIGATLSAQVHQKVTAKCPQTLEAKKGKTYTCTATAADRSKTKVRVVMLDDSGRFRIEGGAG
jgi:hypothetical protein